MLRTITRGVRSNVTKPWSRTTLLATYQQRWNSTVVKDTLRRTPFYDFHASVNAQLVSFAGWEMPLAYREGSSTGLPTIAGHHHTRTDAGLFDVSHMCQLIFSGPSSLKFLQYLTPADLNALPDNQSTLSVILNPEGGIVDDCVVTRLAGDKFYVVVNAGRREADLAHIRGLLKGWKDVELEELETWGLLALQGPKSAKILQELTSQDLSSLHFGQCVKLPTNLGYTIHATRSGYTGEDGFEISLEPQVAPKFADALLKNSSVKWVGLGARDTLRVEAGMCLYGNELDESTSPGEAGLGWVIPKSRRVAGEGSFLGHERVLREFKDGVKRRRVGLAIEGGGVARQHTKIVSGAGTEIGVVTSGIPSPTLGKSISIGYINSSPEALHKSGTNVAVEIRGKQRPAQVVKMPFVPAKYYRG